MGDGQVPAVVLDHGEDLVPDLEVDLQVQQEGARLSRPSEALLLVLLVLLRTLETLLSCTSLSRSAHSSDWARCVCSTGWQLRTHVSSICSDQQAAGTTVMCVILHAIARAG